MSARPPTPYRTRVVRPTLYRSDKTGSLPPDVRDLLVGLATMADDEGWLTWAPREIAATLYPYEPARRRETQLERRAEILVERELLERRDCGCAILPTLKEHHAVKGGEKTQAIWAWHQRECYVGLRSPTDDSVSSSVSESASSSSSDSDKGAAPSSSRAREGIDPDRVYPVCQECHRPTSIHAKTCRYASRLAAVQ